MMFLFGFLAGVIVTFLVYTHQLAKKVYRAQVYTSEPQ